MLLKPTLRVVMSIEYQTAVTASSIPELPVLSVICLKNAPEKSEKQPAASAVHRFESVMSTQSRLSRQQAAAAAKLSTEMIVIAR